TLRLTSEWASSDTPARGDGHLFGLFADRARNCPDHCAIVDGALLWNYRELADAAAKVAAKLNAMGVRPCDPVLICVERSTYFAAAVLGALRVGASPVLLDPRYPERLLRGIQAEHGMPTILLSRTSRLASQRDTARIVNLL